jgi:hypothetical protein
MAKSLALAVLVAGLAAPAAAGGCGESTATCASDCALPDAPANCLATCSAAEAACTTSACSANFQWFLTCVGNAGTYEAISDRCGGAARAARVSVTTYEPLLDAGPFDSALPDAPQGACATATCASVCSSDGPASAGCVSGCEQTQAACGSGAATAYQGLLTCLCMAGGLTPDSSVAPAVCASALDQLRALCPEIMVGDASMAVCNPVCAMTCAGDPACNAMCGC